MGGSYLEVTQLQGRYFGSKIVCKMALRGKPLVYLIYVDESGSSAREPIQITAAVVVRDNLWHAIESSMEAIMQDYILEQDWDAFEFHACDLYQGHGYFENWDRSVRHEILTRILKVLTDYELPVVYGGVDKPRLRTKYIHPADPNDLAFLLCAERVERWFVATAGEESGMFIADETKARKEMKVSVKLYRKIGIPLGIRDERLEHIIDTIHFADSQETFGIQLADFCAYFIKRASTRQKDSEFYRGLQSLIYDWRILP